MIRLESTLVYLAGGEERTVYEVTVGDRIERFYDYAEALAFVREMSYKLQLPVEATC